jgi:hypothetical protein
LLRRGVEESALELEEEAEVLLAEAEVWFCTVITAICKDSKRTYPGKRQRRQRVGERVPIGPQ